MQPPQSTEQPSDASADCEFSPPPHAAGPALIAVDGRPHVMVRLSRIAAGSGMVVSGVLMLVLPGPGLLAIAGGLALLSKDVPAAARLLQWVRKQIPASERMQQVPKRTVVATLSGTLAFTLLASLFFFTR